MQRCVKCQNEKPSEEFAGTYRETCLVCLPCRIKARESMARHAAKKRAERLRRRSIPVTITDRPYEFRTDNRWTPFNHALYRAWFALRNHHKWTVGAHTSVNWCAKHECKIEGVTNDTAECDYCIAEATPAFLHLSLQLRFKFGMQFDPIDSRELLQAAGGSSKPAHRWRR